MDDERLASELQRRASAASPRPDWAQRDLLPAVRHEIDARPVRVAASRWSPLAGLATLVVAILVVAVAAPRLIPSAATSSATPTLIAPATLHHCGAIPNGGFDPSPTFVADTSGAISSCTGVLGMPGGWPAGEATVIARSAGDAANAIEVAWATERCGPERILIEVKRVGSGLAVRVIVDRSGSDGYECVGAGSRPPRRADLTLTEPIDPASVSVELEILPDVHADLPRMVECAAAEGSLAPDRVPTIADHTGVVTGCIQLAAGAPAAGAVDVANLNGFDSVRFDWIDTACDGPIAAEFQAVADGYELDVRQPSEPCTSGDPVAIAIGYGIPMPSQLVTAKLAGPPPAFACAGTQYVTVVDEVGAVQSCAASDSSVSPGDEVGIDNPDGDTSVLRIAWAGSLCAYEVHLRPSGDKYSIDIYNMSAACRLALVVHTVTLRLTTPIHVDEITGWSIGGPPLPPPSSPEPTAEPPRVNVTLVCTSADSASERVVVLTDHAGLIEACSTRLVDWPGEQVVVADVARGVVEIVVEDGCAGASDARLDLWARAEPSSDEPRYVLAVDLRRPVAPFGCHDAIVGIAVDITFMNAELVPESLAPQIEGFMTVDGRGTASAESADGTHRFTLEIGAGKSEYGQNEGIEVSASLTSETDVTVTCPVGPTIGLEQLDGSLKFAAGPFLQFCPGPRDLQGGEPVINEFAPEAWGFSEPNPLGPYLRDGDLYLPEGTYRFFARASLWVGERPGEDRVELEASIVIHVGGLGDSGPTFPTPSPTATVDPNQTVRERIDLYWSGSGSIDCMGMVPPRSLEELVSASALIVIGRAISGEPWSDSEYLPARAVINVEVSEVLKGTLDDQAQRVVRVLNPVAPPGDVSDIDHLLILTRHRDSIFYLTGGFMSIYANVDGRVVTPEYAAIKRVYGDHIFSTALDGIRFSDLLNRVLDAAGSSAQQRLRSDERALFAC